jgi:hypothetical protein
VKSHHGIPDLLELFICSQPVHKRVNNFFEWTRALGFASLRLELVWHSKKLFTRLWTGLEQINQANLVFLDYISQTMAYYPKKEGYFYIQSQGTTSIICQKYPESPPKVNLGYNKQLRTGKICLLLIQLCCNRRG